ncbi:hypothetical protein UM93_11710 [Psychromicrobium lacuslunae]|uniref:Uracil-DNA glycosylase-like domain-containing protein n=1 Tax=Psychromicrobium lacuslunae TaxID=1618207 RepID=A0A0D4C3Y2_9MICC|nr:hypothetical protein UM93_11710 [Psychromicrobium lacuslunae]
MLHDPKIQPLRAWAADLSRRRFLSAGPTLVPHFDPAEAGVEARILILLEAPGPMTNSQNKRPGSGFISVDNNDKTAENCWNYRQEVGLHTGVLHWNIVPWYLGPASRKPNSSELAEGASETLSLLDLLPDLRVVLACGRFAQRGWERHISAQVRPNLTVIYTWHPSPLALNSSFRRQEFREALRRAASVAY